MTDGKFELTCPIPVSQYPQVIMGHGGGGKLSSELLESVFLPAFDNPLLNQVRDSAVLPLAGGQYAFSTDSYVVRPLVFPGGSIGHLAVHGTINDLAMSGARPLFLSAAFILEEGFDIERLRVIAQHMGQAASAAGVRIVTGDTKVVERGHGDGCYINTSGIGVIPPGIELSASRMQVGDAVIVSGTMGDHGMTIMSVREGLEFDAPLQSDTAALHELVATILQACPSVRVLRDPTRGGLAASLNELASAAGLGIELSEAAIPVSSVVQSACEVLGLDPLTVANEGKLVAIVPAEMVEVTLAAMHGHACASQATCIGRVVSEHPRMVTARTRMGATRVVHLPLGELLPRIC